MKKLLLFILLFGALVSNSQTLQARKLLMSQSAPATIVGSTDTDYGTATTTFQVGAPSGTSVGDILIIAIFIDQNYSISTPTGFTSIYGYSGGTNNHNSFRVAWKFATLADLTATFSSTIGAAAKGNITTVSLKGTSSTPPYDASSYLSSTDDYDLIMDVAGSGTSGSMNLAFYNLEFDIGASISPTAGWTLLEGLNIGNINYMGVYSKSQSAASWDAFTISGGEIGNGIGGRIQVKP